MWLVDKPTKESEHFVILVSMYFESLIEKKSEKI